MYFLHRGGWRDIPTPTNKYAKVLWSTFVAPFKFATTKADYILVQFPSGMPMLRKMNIDNIKRFSKTKLIILIHDIETLRDWNDGSNDHQENIDWEMKLINQADGLITQSDKESAFLKAKGINKPMVSLNFYDYYTDCPMQLAHSYQKTICWAGNTVHADFLQKLTIKHKIDVYGPMVKFNNPAIIY